MADVQDPRPDAIVDYLMIDLTAVRQPYRNPPLLRVRGRGACDFNVAGVHLLKETCARAGLITRTPWGVTLAQDPISGNPVLFLSEDQNLQGAPISWSDGGRRAGLYLGDGFRAWKITMAARRGTSFTIPVEPTTRPATGQPGLMLRVDQITWRTAVPRQRKVGG